MDGPEFTARWRSRERQGKVSPSRKGARQTIIGMSANSEAPEINVREKHDAFAVYGPLRSFCVWYFIWMPGTRFLRVLSRGRTELPLSPGV